MNRDTVINVTSVLILIFGLASILIPIYFVSGLDMNLPANSQGLLLLVSAWLLYKRQKFTVVILGISAVMYFVGVSYDADTHNVSLNNLIPAFYWSLLLRVLLVCFVFYLL